jgi:hypothetical protein
MIDRTTKIIMAAIAFGLWANVAVSLFGSARANIGACVRLQYRMRRALLLSSGMH